MRVFLLVLIVGFCLRSNGQVQGWNAFNTQHHEIPWSTARLQDGGIITAAVRHQTFTSHRSLLLIRCNQEGVPTTSGEISLQDTSINTTGGIFMRNDSTYIVFVTFALEQPWHISEHWGYLILDSQFRRLALWIDRPFEYWDKKPIPRKYVCDYLRFRQNEITGEFYGTLVRRNPPDPFHLTDIQEGYGRFNTYLVFSSSLQEQFRRVDTTWSETYIRQIPPYDTFVGYTRIVPSSGGDMLLLNDSEYVTFQGSVHEGYPYSVLHGTTFAEKIKKGVFDPLFPLDTVRNVDNLYSGNPYMLLSSWSDGRFLMSGVGTHEFSDSSQDSTETDIAQAYLAMFDRERKLLKCVFLSPHYNDEQFAGGTFHYNPAVHRNLDFIDRNKLYFTASTADQGFHSPFPDIPSRLQVISLDSNLKVRWRKMIGDPDDATLAQSPYSVIATVDGGCLVFCRKRVRFMYDPYFIYPTSEWDLVVYKLNDQGVVTGTHESSSLTTTQLPVAYPNPAGDRLYFNNAREYDHFKIYDTKGQLMLESDLNEPFIHIDGLATGLYLYTLSGKEGHVHTGKVIKK